MSKSLQYWNSRRARSRLPRIRNTARQKKAAISNMVCFKAGMTGAFFVDDSNSTMKGTEIMSAATVLEIPPTELYGIRVYKRDPSTKYLFSHYEVYDAEAAKHAGIKNKLKVRTLEELSGDGEATEISALLAAYPKTTGIGQHHRIRFESRIIGDKMEDKIKLLSDKLGKEVRVQDVFEDGEFVDITSISKGKGWQGVIKRAGVKRNNHKSTQKIRHGGPLGAYGSGKVFYTIPRAGQMGFNYRTEQNKRILKISGKEEAPSFAPKGGYKNYGDTRNDVIIMKGSVVGPANRLVRIKKSMRGKNSTGITKPKIIEIG